MTGDITRRQTLKDRIMFTVDWQQRRAAATRLRNEQFATHHQLGRLVEPDEVAALLAWLCGPDSDAITGAVLPVDAGMTAS